MGEADYGMGLILLSPLPGRIDFSLKRRMVHPLCRHPGLEAPTPSLS
jgi:hypothetical protein